MQIFKINGNNLNMELSFFGNSRIPVTLIYSGSKILCEIQFSKPLLHFLSGYQILHTLDNYLLLQHQSLNLMFFQHYIPSLIIRDQFAYEKFKLLSF